MRPKGTAWRWTAKGSSTSGRTPFANTIRRPAKLVGEVPRTPERQPGADGGDAGGPLTNDHVPGRGSARACRGISQRRRAGALSPIPRPQAAREAAIAAFRAKYPPTTPMIVGGHRRDTARRTGSRTLRRRQLPGRARDGVRPGHAPVQARLGRVWTHARRNEHQRRRPRVYARRPDAQGVPRPPHAEHIQ